MPIRVAHEQQPTAEEEEDHEHTLASVLPSLAHQARLARSPRGHQLDSRRPREAAGARGWALSTADDHDGHEQNEERLGRFIRRSGRDRRHRAGVASATAGLPDARRRRAHRGKPLRP